jgi:hypothetical protein
MPAVASNTRIAVDFESAVQGTLKSTGKQARKIACT